MVGQSVWVVGELESAHDAPVFYCRGCGAGIARSAFPEPGADTRSYACPRCGITSFLPPVVPGFPDLDTRRRLNFFRAFATVLRERPLRSFEECNEFVGSANGFASGMIAAARAELVERGYLRPIAGTEGVELTAKGTAAAKAAGILSD